VNELTHVYELLGSHGRPVREVYYDLEKCRWVSKKVVEAMPPYFNTCGYGYSSIMRKPSWEALEAVLKACYYIAKTLGAKPSEIIFAYSGTEANNLTIIDSILAYKDRGEKTIISAIGYYSVMLPANELGKYGFKVDQILVDIEGFVDLDTPLTIVNTKTILTSIQMVNYEIEAIQPVKETVEVVSDRNPNTIVHTGTIDAYTRIPIDVEKLDIDLLSISSHKVLGLKGAGAPYVREGAKLKKILHGTLSTQQYWPEVENVPAMVGFHKADELAFTNMEENLNYVKRLRDKLLKGIPDRVCNVLVNGPAGKGRVFDNLNVNFLYLEGEALIVELSLRGVYVSSGSACTSRVLKPSHVLLAIGRKHEEAYCDVLIKISRYYEDVDCTLEQIPEALQRLRALSSFKPLG